MRSFGTRSLAGLKAASYQLVPLTKLLLSGQHALLICDGVGVGKTISAGYILTYLCARHRRPGLVLCPPGLQEKWRLELRDKFAFSVVPIRSSEELDGAHELWSRESTGSNITFVMPSSFLSRLSIPLSFPGPIIIDEIHNYRNTLTNLWRAASHLLTSSSYRVGLSATPINNDLTDLAAELALLFRIGRHPAEAIINDLWRPTRRSLLYPVLTRFLKDRLHIHFASREVVDARVQYPEEYLRKVVATVKIMRQRP